MSVSFENIALALLAGLVLGLLPSTIADRKGFRPVIDIGFGVVAVFAAAWLVVAWRDLIPGVANFWSGKPVSEASREEGPNYEPVVLPLAPLHPLLKPVVYRSREEVCDTLTQAAQRNDLPVHFFIRLLYQESSFRPEAISSAGAFGIAQFMPETATDRRLDNPFDPVQAIGASARLLRDLNRKFGNLGLAAAAYNAGPRRIEDWRANKGPLPAETQDYVRAVTGWPIETWSIAMSGSPAVKIPPRAPCQEAAGLLASDGPDEIPLPAPDPRATALASAKGAHPATTQKKIQDAKNIHEADKIQDADNRARKKEPTSGKIAASQSAATAGQK